MGWKETAGNFLHAGDIRIENSCQLSHEKLLP